MQRARTEVIEAGSGWVRVRNYAGSISDDECHQLLTNFKPLTVNKDGSLNELIVPEGSLQQKVLTSFEIGARTHGYQVVDVYPTQHTGDQFFKPTIPEILLQLPGDLRQQASAFSVSRIIEAGNPNARALKTAGIFLAEVTLYRQST